MAVPARKVVSRSPQRSVYLINLPHLQTEPIQCESSLEFAAAHIFALAPWTTSVKHQPFRMNLAEGTYTPDFLVTFIDGSHAVVETKPEVFHDQHRARLDEAAQILGAKGTPFFVIGVSVAP